MPIAALKNEFIPKEALPLVAVTGTFNTGKSTLINALLGQDISPVDAVPATMAQIHLSYGAKTQTKIYDHTGAVFTADGLPAANRLATAQWGRKRRPQITKIETTLPHHLLQLFSLLDTPGFNAAAQRQPDLKHLAAADHIVYLLHQRGLTATDEILIRALVRMQGADHLSFWINCNLGQWDGSSLAESRRQLRELCSRQVTVNAISTKDPQQIAQCKSFLCDLATQKILEQVKRAVKKLDQGIPQIVAAALTQTEDALFLAAFYPAREDTRRILRARELMASPSGKAPKPQTRPCLLPQAAHHPPPLVQSAPAAMPDPAQIKAEMRALFNTIRAAPKLGDYPEISAKMGQLLSQLEQEEYLVTAVGGFSCGKSTFYNALLGESLLPAENRPTTFAITRLKYGPAKEAAVDFAQRVQIPTHRQDQHSAVLCRHQLAILEHWLTDQTLRSQITALEKGNNGVVSPISAAQLLAELEQLKTTFARIKRNHPRQRRSWKSLFKSIPQGRFKKDSPADFYRVHLTKANTQRLDLETAAGRRALAELAGSHLALRVAAITVRHPSPFLRLATFVDTPGLDSVYQRHREITSQYLPHTDCFIVMLNGKHVLTKQDLALTKAILKKSHRQPWAQKLFIVVNFTDTLTGWEQEKVRSYLRRQLAAAQDNPIPSGRIYFISAQQALQGQKTGEFSRLTRHLKTQIWLGRCRDHYRQYLNEAKLCLQFVSSPEPPPEKHDALRELAEVTALTKQKMLPWRNLISSFKSGQDFVGFREGRLVSRRGFWGLSRRMEQTPCCRDLVREINAPLQAFWQRWGQSINAPPAGIAARKLEAALETLLGQSPSLAAAKQSVLALLAREEAALLNELHSLQLRWEKEASRPLDPEIAPILAQYLSAIEELEQNISATGGIKDGKRPDAGSPIA